MAGTAEDKEISHPCIFRYAPSVSINYEVDGHGEVPLVFVHGFASSLVTWHDIRSLLPKNRFKLFLLDLKGFGFSSKPLDGAYSLFDQADIIIAFIRAFGLRNVVLVGHSFGGSVALEAALKSAGNHVGNLIGKLILLDSAAYPQRLPRLMRILRRPLLSRFVIRLCPTRLIVWYTLIRVFRNRKAVTAARITRYSNCFDRRGMAYVLIRTVEQLAAANREGTIGGYGAIRIPVLIVWGKDDRITEMWQADRLHDEIEGSRLELIDDCGHNPHEEYPEKTCSLILGFIAE
jgi:pimeloyl-ACP methyl ester carboxylesterase